jgi:hypothetical protein
MSNCLPSGDAALSLVRTGSPLPVVQTFLLRGAIITASLALAGARGSDLWKYAFAATAGVEAAVIIWAAIQPSK